MTAQCKRKKLSPAEAQKATKEGNHIFQVGKEVIQAIPRLPTKETYTFAEVYKKFQGKCAIAGKEVYLIDKKQKRPYPNYKAAYVACKGKIAPISYEELRVIPDGVPFARPSNTHPPLKKKKTPKKLSMKQACKNLVDKEHYAFRSKIFQAVVAKSKAGALHCSLVEINKHSQKERDKIAHKKLIELSPNQIVSLHIVKKEKGSKK